MSKKKKNGNEKKVATIILITAIIQLIQVVLEIIKMLLE